MHDRVPLGFTFDCTNARMEADFWCVALGYVPSSPPTGWASWEGRLRDQEVPESEWDDGASICPPEGVAGPTVSFLKVSEGKTAKNRIHLDLKVSGGRHLDAALRTTRIRASVAELVAAGATVQSEHLQSGGKLDHVVCLDPEGNEFCVV